MSTKDKKYNFSYLGTAIAIGSYFLIKYGIVAQFFQDERFPFVYNLILIAGCMLFGNAVDRAVQEFKARD